MMFFKLGHKTYLHNLYRVLQSLMTINLAGVLQRFYICMRYAIWCHLHNFKNVKITCSRFSCFLNCTNGTKSRNISHKVIIAGFGKMFCSLQRSSIALLVLLRTLFRWSLNVNPERDKIKLNFQPDQTPFT